MLACDQTVTFVRCDGESYTLTPVSGVSWYDKTRIQTDGFGLVFGNSVMIRIPSEVVPKELPKTGDQVILGTLETVPKTPAELAPFHPRRVMSVGDNRRGSRPHVVVAAQ